MTGKDFVVSADGHLLEPIDAVQGPPARPPARPGGVGRGDRGRAAGARRRHRVPQAAHARLRGLDRVALPPDQRPHPRGRPRDHPRGHGHRRRRRPGAAPEPLPVRPVHRPPRDVDRPCPGLQRLRPRALQPLLRPAGPDRPDPADRHPRRRGRDRAGGGRRLPGRAAAGHRPAALLLPRLRAGVGRHRRHRPAGVRPHPDRRHQGRGSRGPHPAGDDGERRAGQPAHDRAAWRPSAWSPRPSCSRWSPRR